MKKTSKDLLKNTIIIGIGTICTKLISFIMVPFYTMWLNPSEYGEFDLMVSYLTLFVSLITLQLEQALFRFSLKDKDNSKNFLFNTLIVTMLNMIFLNCLVIAFFKNSSLKLGFILYFDAYALFVIFSEYLRGNERLKTYSFFNIISSIILLVLSIILVPVLKMGVKGLMYAYAIGFCVSDLLMIFYLKVINYIKYYKFKIDEYKKMLIYSLPLIPNGISWWITNVSDRSIINYYIGNYYNGIYAVACKLPTIISLVYGIFNLSWQQTAIQSHTEANIDNYYKKVLTNLIKFLFSISIFLVGFLPFLFNYLLNKKYYEAIYYVPILLLGSVFLCLGQFLGGILLACNNTKKIGYTTMISAIINIIINFLLIKKFGVIIAAISTLVSYIYFFFRRYLLINEVKNRSIIFLIVKLCIIYLLISIIFIVVSNLFLIIILNIVVILIILLYNKELILKIISYMKKTIKKLSEKNQT